MPQPPAETGARRTATQVLAEQLRVRILDGDVEPGQPLREEDLAAHYEVSRHTVRAALAALASERLVEVAPYRGARVAQLDDSSLVALQELRGALEAEAVRLVNERYDHRWPDDLLVPVRAAIDQLDLAEGSGDWQRTTRAHADVHRSIVAAAASERITDAYQRLDSEILLLLTHVRPQYAPGAFTHEHRDYLTEIQRRGGAAVREHLAHSTQLIVAARRSRIAGRADNG